MASSSSVSGGGALSSHKIAALPITTATGAAAAAAAVSQQQQSAAAGGNGGAGAGGGGTGTAGTTPAVMGGGGGGKAPRRASGTKSHSRSYPRGVGLDFRKLAGLTLLSYIDHHGVPVRPDAPPSELAVAVARHFESMEVDEEECMSGFLQRLEMGAGFGGIGVGVAGGGGGGGAAAVAAALTGSHSGVCDYPRHTAYYDGRAPALSVRKRQRSKWSARPGEQVAAKVTRTDENGSWILAVVQRFYADTDTYDVQDEDDSSKLIRLPFTHVMRLSTGSEGFFKKGTDCMAIFPETTSFYRAIVSKTPLWRLEGRSGNNVTPLVKELIVKFEDDEDSTTGKTPHRRVPARFVTPLPSAYFFDDADDVDLTPPPAVNVVMVTGTQ